MNEAGRSLFDFFQHFVRNNIMKIGGRWAQAWGKWAEAGLVQVGTGHPDG